MSQDADGPVGPDLREGVPLAELLEDEPFVGHVDGEQVLLVRRGEAVSAVGAVCTHWGGPLWEGLAVDGMIRCPWHHACFSLETGRVLGPPALDDLPRWMTLVDEGFVTVTGRAPGEGGLRRGTGSSPSVVIVGAGAAGSYAALTLRREGHAGAIVILDPEGDAPYDRPNLSKDYLAGNAPEEWLTLRTSGDWSRLEVERRVEAVASIDPEGRTVGLGTGERLSWDALLLTTGATPRRLDGPGFDRPHVVTLRSLADSRRLIELLEAADDLVVVGAGFIGMEVAAAARQRGVRVTVVAPDRVPFARVLGEELGRRLLDIQTKHGVRFEPGRRVTAVEEGGVVLDDGSRLPAECVLVAVGVRPETDLAERAGLAVDDGIVVDDRLATSAPGVWAAGDAARFPDPRTGKPLRIEHWAVAQKQGQVAARNMLGADVPYTHPPFFWTTLFGTSVEYVGHAEGWDELRVDGDAAAGDVLVRYLTGGDTAATASVGRPIDSLRSEVDLERRWREGGAR